MEKVIRQPENPYITAADIVRRMSCSKPTAYEIMRQCLSYICIGKGSHGIRILESDLDAWVRRRTQKSKAELQARMYPDIRPYRKRSERTSSL